MKEENRRRKNHRACGFLRDFNSFLVHFMIITNTQSWQKSRSLNSSIYGKRNAAFYVQMYIVYISRLSKQRIQFHWALQFYWKESRTHFKSKQMIHCFPVGQAAILFHSMESISLEIELRIEFNWSKTLGLTNISDHEPVNIHKCIYI